MKSEETMESPAAEPKQIVGTEVARGPLVLSCPKLPAQSSVPVPPLTYPPRGYPKVWLQDLWLCQMRWLLHKWGRVGEVKTHAESPFAELGTRTSTGRWIFSPEASNALFLRCYSWNSKVLMGHT